MSNKPGIVKYKTTTNKQKQKLTIP